MTEIEEFVKLHPDLKYPIWKVGKRYFLHSHKGAAEAYASQVRQAVETVEKIAAKITGKKGDKNISDGAE